MSACGTFASRIGRNRENRSSRITVWVIYSTQPSARCTQGQPHEKALEIARKLCSGLAAAHEQGIVHRDLKPGNVMLDRKGQVWITNFGLANLAGQVTDIRSGTPAYMAPEPPAKKGQCCCSRRTDEPVGRPYSLTGIFGRIAVQSLRQRLH